MQVRARWDDGAGPWQQLVLRRAQDGACSSAEPLRYGDALSLTIAHLGKYVRASAVAGGRVCADRQRQGEFGAREPLAQELFVLERAVVGARDGAVVGAWDGAVVGARDGAVVHVGEAVRLRTAAAGEAAAAAGEAAAAAGEAAAAAGEAVRPQSKRRRRQQPAGVETGRWRRARTAIVRAAPRLKQAVARRRLVTA